MFLKFLNNLIKSRQEWLRKPRRNNSKSTHATLTE